MSVCFLYVCTYVSFELKTLIKTKKYNKKFQINFPNIMVYAKSHSLDLLNALTLYVYALLTHPTVCIWAAYFESQSNVLSDSLNAVMVYNVLNGHKLKHCASRHNIFCFC